MSRRPAGLLFEDMLERIRRNERSVAGMDHESFLRNDTAIDAVIRNLTVIGEAANRLPQEFKDRDVFLALLDGLLVSQDPMSAERQELLRSVRLRCRLATSATEGR